MKPDGVVVTAAAMPMESLDPADPMPEAGPPVEGEGADPVAQAVTQEGTEHGVSQAPEISPPAPAAAKTEKNKTADSKTKTATTKGPPKSKMVGDTGTKPIPKSGTAQSRLLNGTQKPTQTNGVAKKPASATVTEKKASSTTGPAKRPTTAAAAPASRPPSKPAEKKPPGLGRPTTAPSAMNGAKTGAAQPLKKGPSAMSSDIKTKPKTTASRPTSAAPSRPLTAASTKSDKPPVSKTTSRPPSGPPSSRPSPAASKTATTKTTPQTKPPTPKATSTSAGKPATPKTGSTTPSAGRTPTSATKTPTQAKKDVSKPIPAAAASKKPPTASSLSRPSPAKTTKPDTPKSTPAAKPDSTKKPAASNKAADPKASKPKEAKSTPSKDASKMAGARPASAKAASPKKAVGSSTPTPVKRGSKPAAVAQPQTKEEEKKVEDTPPAVVAAIATAAVAGVVAAAALEMEAPVMETASPLVKELEPAAAVKDEPVAKAPELLETAQLATHLDLVHLDEAEPTKSPLGTTVISPATSPIGSCAPVMPFQCQASAPLMDMPAVQEAWMPSDEALPERPMKEWEKKEAEEKEKEEMKMQEEEEEEETKKEEVRMQEEEKEEEEKEQKEMRRQRDDKEEEKEMTMESDHEEEEEKEEEEMSLQKEKEEVRDWDGEMRIQDDFNAPSSGAMADFQAEDMLPHDMEMAAHHGELEKTFPQEAQPDLLFTTPAHASPAASPSSPLHEREEAVEKADEEINEDVDEGEEEEPKDHQKMQDWSTVHSLPEPSTVPHMEGFLVENLDAGSSDWQGHGFDDMSSQSQSSNVERITNLVEDTHLPTSALDDFGFKLEKTDEPYVGSESANAFYGQEKDEDEPEEEERVVAMDVGSEKHDAFGGEEEEDEDVEMVSEGLAESGGNLDTDELMDDLHGDTLHHMSPQPAAPPSTAWAQSNPFTEPWAQPASNLFNSSPSPDAVAAHPETPTKSPAQAWLDFASQPDMHHSEEPSAPAALEEIGSTVPEEFTPAAAELAAPPVAMSQSSTLSGTALAAHSSSETSTPEELQDYDSSSGVESRSEKQQTPVPVSMGAVQPDMEQDLGIHLERGDGEEEEAEAETLPADEVLGGPPTAPASAPSSASTSGDEASDTEGEMQINDPDAPVGDDCMLAFSSAAPARSLSALAEDEEAGDAHMGDCADEDGGTPQSANSVASYGFDCTNSNAHSMAESCGKSPGIFSLENEEQLPEEAKDPSLIKELTLPSSAAAATAQVDELFLGSPVDLLPVGHSGDLPCDEGDLEEHGYMLCGKSDLLQEAGDPLGSEAHLSSASLAGGDNSDGQPPYYSTICDKTDNFLAGNV